MTDVVHIATWRRDEKSAIFSAFSADVDDKKFKFSSGLQAFTPPTY